MATQLWLQDTKNSGVGVYRDLKNARGPGVVSGVVNNSSIGAGTEAQWTKTGGGELLTFISSPVHAFTLSGAIEFNFWAKESSSSGNVGVRVHVYKRTAAGVETELAGSPWGYGGTAPGTELSSTMSAKNFTGTPSSGMAFADNDYIVIRVFIQTTGGAIGGGTTSTLDYYGSGAAADGDSYITLTEAVSFFVIPKYQSTAGSLSFTGGLSTSASFHKSLSGALDFVGGLIAGARKAIGGVLSLTGAMAPRPYDANAHYVSPFDYNGSGDTCWDRQANQIYGGWFGVDFGYGTDPAHPTSFTDWLQCGTHFNSGDGSYTEFRPYLHFDLSAIPSNSSCLSAKLKLYQWGETSGGQTAGTPKAQTVKVCDDPAVVFPASQSMWNPAGSDAATTTPSDIYSPNAEVVWDLIPALVAPFFGRDIALELRQNPLQDFSSSGRNQHSSYYSNRGTEIVLGSTAGRAGLPAHTERTSPILTLTYQIGTTIFQSVVGTLSFGGSLVRTTEIGKVGALSFFGAETRAISSTKSGSVSFSGASLQRIWKNILGLLTFLGAAARLTTKSPSGDLGFAGGSNKRAATIKTGSLGFSHVYQKQPVKNIAAALSFATALWRNSSKKIFRNLSFSRRAAKQAFASILGSLSFTRSFSATRVFLKMLFSSLSFIGYSGTSIRQLFYKFVSGAATFNRNLLPNFWQRTTLFFTAKPRSYDGKNNFSGRPLESSQPFWARAYDYVRNFRARPAEMQSDFRPRPPEKAREYKARKDS